MKFIPNGITRQVARQFLIARKNSPQVMFVGGVAGVTVGTVMACRATLQLSDQLDKMKNDLEDVKALKDADGSYDNKDVARVYAKNMAKVARLYAPAAIVGVASIGALTGAHVTLNRRNAGLTAAYAAAVKAYDDYRDRIKEELGEEKELDLYHGAIVEKVKGEDNKLVAVKKVNPNSTSMYARFFDESSRNWDRNPEMNRMFVQVQQTYANDLLVTRGHIFLNEVYDMLGLERSKAGQVVGWVISDEGDNRVDFGIYEAVNANFVNGIERTALLDFNVDGVIYDLI